MEDENDFDPNESDLMLAQIDCQNDQIDEPSHNMSSSSVCFQNKDFVERQDSDKQISYDERDLFDEEDDYVFSFEEIQNEALVLPSSQMDFNHGVDPVKDGHSNKRSEDSYQSMKVVNADNSKTTGESNAVLSLKERLKQR